VGEQAKRGVPWTLLSYGGSKVISVLTTLVLARLLEPSTFGLLALAMIATNFLYWVADSGLSSAVVVRRDFGPRELGTMLTLITLTGVAAAAIAIALSPLANVVFHDSRVAPVIIAVSAILPIGAVTGFYEALLLRELLFRRRCLATIGQALLTAAVSIVLAVLGDGVWSLVIGQLVGYGALMLAFIMMAPFRVRPRADRATMRESWTSGRGFFIQGMLQYVRLNVDTITVGIAFGQRRLGYYSMASRFGDLVYWLISHPIATVTFPSFAKSRHEGEEIASSFLQVLGTVALVSAPIGILMSAAAEPFTHAVFGPRWLPMAGPLTVMGLWAMVRQIDTTLQWLLNSIAHAGAMARVSVVVLIPLMLGCWLAASVGGLTAVALVPLGDTLLSAAITGILVQRYASISVRDQVRAVLPAVAASVPTWIVTWGVGQLVGPDSHAVLSLLAAVAAGGATYMLCIRVLAPELLRRLFVELAGMLGRRPAPVAHA
jgi:lipopolysaccharide exporter